MEEFTSFFKYFSDDPRVIDGVFKNNRIRFTQPWGMNDPLEFNPTIKIDWQENPHQFYELDQIFLPSLELLIRAQAIESQINTYGILSLTKQPSSFNMWSQYANGHKGFVLEFKPDFSKHSCMKSESGTEYVVRKVEYVDNYQLDLAALENHEGVIPLETLRDEMIFKKTSRWKHEEEYRLVRSLKDYPGYKPLSNYSHRDNEVYLFEIDLECIESVVFGANMSADNKREIFDSCKDRKINFYQAFIIRNKKDEKEIPGKVILFPLRQFESIEWIYAFGPQLFVIDEGQATLPSTKKIRKLSEIPYYEDYKKEIELVYKKLKRL